MTDLAGFQKEAAQIQALELSNQYAPKQYEQEQEARQLKIDTAKREESDITGYSKAATDIMAKKQLATTPDAPEDTRGGYEDPSITKLNDTIKSSKVAAQTQAESKAKLSALAMQADIHHNPTLARQLRSDADKVDSDARQLQTDVMEKEGKRLEIMGQYAVGFKANPSPQAKAEMVLDMLTKNLITPDQARGMSKATTEELLAKADGVIAASDTSSIRARSAIATQKAESLSKWREHRIEVDTQKAVFADRKQASKESRDSAKDAKLDVTRLDKLSKDYISNIKSEGSYLQKDLIEIQKNEQILLKERADIESLRVILPKEDKATRLASIESELLSVGNTKDKVSDKIKDNEVELREAIRQSPSQSSGKGDSKPIPKPASSENPEYVVYKAKFNAAKGNVVEQARLTAIAKSHGLLK